MTLQSRLSKGLSNTLGIHDIQSGFQKFQHGRGLLKIGLGLAKFIGTAMTLEDLVVSPFIQHPSSLMRVARRVDPSLRGNSLMVDELPHSLQRWRRRRNYTAVANTEADVEMAPLQHQHLPLVQHFARQESQRLGLSRHGLELTEWEMTQFAPHVLQRHLAIPVLQRLTQVPDEIGGLGGLIEQMVGVGRNEPEDDDTILSNFIGHRLSRHGGVNIRYSLSRYDALRNWNVMNPDTMPIRNLFPYGQLVRQHRLGYRGNRAVQEIMDASPELQRVLNFIRQDPDAPNAYRTRLRDLTGRDTNYALQFGQGEDFIIPLRADAAWGGLCILVGISFLVSIPVGIILSLINDNKKENLKK